MLDITNFDTKILDCLATAGYLIEIIDKNGAYVYASDTYEEISPKAIIGKKVNEVYNYHNDYNKSVLLKTLFLASPIRNALYEYKSSTGKSYYDVMDATPLMCNGEVLGVIGIAKPFKSLRSTVERVNRIQHADASLINANRDNNTAHYVFEDIVHSSTLMQQIIDDAKKIAIKPASVLIYGETGTGKELFAQSIHNYSVNAGGPFVAVNCGAIPDTLLEGTLFGTSKGSYTGAIDKKGLFEEAQSGTIFLDEINSLSFSLQAKLLRALEEKKIRRVGSNKEISINARIISAMNIKPADCLENKVMRSDLFYRLAVTTIEIPSLRERHEDISALCNYFIKQQNITYGKNIAKIDNEVIGYFDQYEWPGNIRELRHVIEHSMNMVDDDEDVITAEHLPNYFLNMSNAVRNTSRTEIIKAGKNFKEARSFALKEYEMKFTKYYISCALEACNNNIKKTADYLGISRQYLHHLIAANNILIHSQQAD
jgi:arginine utilization regulatory protein